jgi:hypothetical protein
VENKVLVGLVGYQRKYMAHIEIDQRNKQHKIHIFVVVVE